MRRVLAFIAAVSASLSAIPLASTAIADSVGAICADSLWMKLSHDSATGQEMVCAGADPDTNLTWQATGKPPATLFSDLPIAGAAGSPCNHAEGFRQSSDGYVVECRSGKVLLPGHSDFTNSSTKVWSLYSP
jgi:hypothetical protein